MLYKFSRVLQFLGLVILPVALSGNLAEQLTLWQSLTLSSVGVLLFCAGWQLQQWTKPK